MDISISIVTYNSCHVMEKCLAGIPLDIPIFVFDNNSSDNTVAYLEKLNRPINIIKSKHNIGFGQGHNQNSALVKTKYMLILNPDCFVTKSSLETLIDVANAHPNCAIVGPVLTKDQDATVQTIQNNEITDFVCGACMLLRMSIFLEIGFFDKNIFLYFEDDEICWRAKKAGYDLLITKSAQVNHLKGQSTLSSNRLLWVKGYYFGKAEIYFSLKKSNNNKIIQLFCQQFLYTKVMLKALFVTRNFGLASWYFSILLGLISYTIKPSNSGYFSRMIKSKKLV